MKLLSSYVATALALVPAVLAQAGTVLDLPQCGQQVILQAIQTTGCPLTDIACICGNKEFVDELVEQIPLLCSAEDIALTAQGSADICFAYGIEVDIPDFTNATSSATSAGSAVSTSASATSSAAPTTIVSASASETEASASETATATASAAAETGNGAILNPINLTGLAGAALLGAVAVYL